ncbi:GYD domain-containing protein [Candidatus Bathyarchaeota archaeon]|nr:GYD domain-containing protein [Candidatus Bathyarchaeota archaeon]
MATYVLLSTLTAEGRKTIKNKPERILEVNKEIETFGVKVLHQYAVLGPYDFVNVIEAPDNETILRISLELGSRGTMNIISMPSARAIFQNLFPKILNLQTTIHV